MPTGAAGRVQGSLRPLRLAAAGRARYALPGGGAESAMDWLIWTGAGLSVLGLCGIVWCILQAMAARRAGLPDAALRARLQRIVAVNLAALLLSVIGLMVVIVGIFLG